MTLDPFTRATLVIASLIAVGAFAGGLLWVANHLEQIERRERSVVRTLRANAQLRCRGSQACATQVARRAERCVRENARHKYAGKQMREMIGVHSIERFHACVGLPPEEW
jgi:hypothetical protein